MDPATLVSAGPAGAATIAAVATPSGPGGIGIVRLSGPRAWEVGRRLFHPRHPWPAPANPPVQRLVYGQVVDPACGAIVDEVLGVFFRAPHSYTTEDTVELQGHGGPVVLRRILELALAAGCRLAAPGEFTLRAFWGGRLDLAEAEAVAELVAAGSRREAELALGSLAGGLGRCLAPVREALVRAGAAVEALVDFPDEAPHLDLAGLTRSLAEEVLAPLERLLAQAASWRVYREGAQVVVCGRPNVGKSTLFNALLGRSRALVSPLAGTTRDVLEESAVLGGVVCRLTDTAGLGPALGELDALGMAAARERLAQADLALVLLDGSAPLTPADQEILAATRGLPRLVVRSKADLPWAWESAPPELSGPGPLPGLAALTGQGLEELARNVGAALAGGAPEPPPGQAVANSRQAAALARVREGVRTALAGLTAAEPPAELVSLDLAAALAALGEVDGRGAPDEVIDAVFANFCVGK
ncbi:MAG: tRNA uridine-5-carboxymethylaminomethyl(34) synthesis GTPase MnmE [Deltaproteobacteria bacterium]|nr:tRNA uridine-5-carboxymethylaminomethyl(34) synthesis GTPase MnmE [Deltaproteobacteria bacterium]